MIRTVRSPGFVYGLLLQTCRYQGGSMASKGTSAHFTDIVRNMKKVELHVHLDGSLRHSTLFELGKRKNLLQEGTLDEFKDNIIIRSESTGNLTKFLASFKEFMPCVIGDRVAIRQMAVEFCEDMSHQNVVYCEVRYCPHILANGLLTPEEVVRIISQGLADGQKQYGIKVRSILCCIREHPEWSMDILKLCVQHKNLGIVGIDIAGGESNHDDENGIETHDNHLDVFKKALEMGVHRTVHAGENGPSETVREAVYEMYAERIGHGYHTLDDPQLYRDLREQKIHFEVCPISSYITESVPTDWKKHPLKRFVEDDANFSINSDDPTLTGSFVSGDYEVCLNKLGLTVQDLRQANINAARACFLPDDERKELIEIMEGQ